MEHEVEERRGGDNVPPAFLGRQEERIERPVIHVIPITICWQFVSRGGKRRFMATRSSKHRKRIAHVSGASLIPLRSTQENY
jgi:hypothetical protein